jgi:uncharacterized protein YjlB
LLRVTQLSSPQGKLLRTRFNRNSFQNNLKKAGFSGLFYCVKVTPFVFPDDGSIPNNPLPLLVYSQLDVGRGRKAADQLERMFSGNGWSRFWRNGIYSFHHYHSTSHEVLGCYQGEAKVLLGGENGKLLNIHAGDVILIPAGVGHFNKGSSADFGVIGGYPKGFDWDMQYGRPEERPAVLENIAALPVPPRDPIFGLTGGLTEYWTAS